MDFSIDVSIVIILMNLKKKKGRGKTIYFANWFRKPLGSRARGKIVLKYLIYFST